jgi:hypothetical protein
VSYEVCVLSTPEGPELKKFLLIAEMFHFLSNSLYPIWRHPKDLPPSKDMLQVKSIIQVGSEESEKSDDLLSGFIPLTKVIRSP